MATLTHTYTTTYTLLHPWASTTPVAEDDASPHYQGARVGDPCCAEGCDKELKAGDEVYSPTEPVDANPGRDLPWVCWRHVRPDDGPVS